MPSPPTSLSAASEVDEPRSSISSPSRLCLGSPEPEKLSISDETPISPPVGSTSCASFLGFGFPLFSHFSWKSKGHLQPSPSCPHQLQGTKSCCPTSGTSSWSVPVPMIPQLLSRSSSHQSSCASHNHVLHTGQKLGMQIWLSCTLLLKIPLWLCINNYRLKSTLHGMRSKALLQGSQAWPCGRVLDYAFVS